MIADVYIGGGIIGLLLVILIILAIIWLVRHF